jgi:hypothetical protein
MCFHALHRSIHGWICSLIIAASPLVGAVKLHIEQGCPIADGVYVNGHGPYRFLLDTGSNTDFLAANVAKSIGLNATSQLDVTAVSSTASFPVSGDNRISLDSETAEGQELVLSSIAYLQNLLPGIQGLLGEPFLSRFDYGLDFRARTLEFRSPRPHGTHVSFESSGGRPFISTSLGNLILDSGAPRVVLFRPQAPTRRDKMRQMLTIAGTQLIEVVRDKSLSIEGKRIWEGEAVVVSNHSEPGVDGLMPLSVFQRIYVCNSETYIVF